MRLNTFVISEGRSKTIHPDKAIPLIRKECKQSIAAIYNGNGIYRGNWGENSPVLYIQPSKSSRASANTSNMYTLIIDNHPKWKSYPKRSKSIICTNHPGEAESYGDVYHVFTKDGSNFGVCPESDMWNSFEKGLKGQWLDNMNHDIAELMKSRGIDTRPLYGENYEKLKMALLELDENLFTKGFVAKHWHAWGKHYDGDWLKLLQEVLEPRLNGFYNTKDPKRLPKGWTPSHEIWTDGDAYLVNKKHFKNLGQDILK